MKSKSFVCAVITASILLVACGKDSISILKNVQTLEAKGDYAAAIAELSYGLRADPSNGILHYHRGRIYSLMFDEVAAEHEFRKASHSGAVEGGRVALGLGRALIQQRKYREVTTDVVAAPAFEQGILAGVHVVRGHALMALDRIGEAKKELEAAFHLDPGNADVILLQARFMAEGRDIEGALRVVEKLLAQNSKNVEAWIHRADLLTIMGKPKEALAAFSKAIDLQPLHQRALVGRAMILVQTGRLGDAQKDVDRLRKAYPKQPEAAYLRGQIHYWRGEYREALGMAQGALRMNQEDGPARLLSGMAHLMLDAPAQAEHEFARYLTGNPRSMVVRRVLMDLRMEMSRKGSGVKILGSTHADELRAASVQALSSDAYIRTWQHSKAAEWMQRVAASTVLDWTFAVKQAQRRFSREQLDLAASDLERIVALTDGIKATDCALVLVQLARSDTAKASNAVSAMEAKSPDNAQAAMLAGIVALERNQREEATRRLDEALRRDPRLVAAVASRARLDLAAENPDLARKRFEDVLAAEPDNLVTLVIYALVEEATRRRSEAHKLLARAIKAHPKALEPKVVLIGILRKENAKTRAVEVAEEMLAAHSDDPVALEVAAEIQLWNGDRDRGLATLKQLVAVLPKSPESHFKLARAQFSAGLTSDGEESLVRALALPIDDAESRGLPLWGLIDDSKTLAAIESARKSYKPRPRPSYGSQGGGDLWSGQIGGSAFRDGFLGAPGGGR